MPPGYAGCHCEHARKSHDAAAYREFLEAIGYLVEEGEIVSGLRSSVASALGCGESEVGVVTVDIPSKWNMEGGSLLPEPGEEA